VGYGFGGGIGDGWERYWEYVEVVVKDFVWLLHCIARRLGFGWDL
jgi:hypothetical protein